VSPLSVFSNAFLTLALSELRRLFVTQTVMLDALLQPCGRRTVPQRECLRQRGQHRLALQSRRSRASAVNLGKSACGRSYEQNVMLGALNAPLLNQQQKRQTRMSEIHRMR